MANPSTGKQLTMGGISGISSGSTVEQNSGDVSSGSVWELELPVEEGGELKLTLGGLLLDSEPRRPSLATCQSKKNPFQDRTTDIQVNNYTSIYLPIRPTLVQNVITSASQCWGHVRHNCFCCKQTG